MSWAPSILRRQTPADVPHQSQPRSLQQVLLCSEHSLRRPPCPVRLPQTACRSLSVRCPHPSRSGCDLIQHRIMGLSPVLAASPSRLLGRLRRDQFLRLVDDRHIVRICRVCSDSTHGSVHWKRSPGKTGRLCHRSTTYDGGDLRPHETKTSKSTAWNLLQARNFRQSPDQLAILATYGDAAQKTVLCASTRLPAVECVHSVVTEQPSVFFSMKPRTLVAADVGTRSHIGAVLRVRAGSWSLWFEQRKWSQMVGSDC